MASGKSSRYGKNKLTEMIGGRQVILHTADHLREAGGEREIFLTTAVTRSDEVCRLLKENGISCVLHDKPKKSDTIHIGVSAFDHGPAGFQEPAGFYELEGYLFMPGDQPLVLPETLRGMACRFFERPSVPLRLGYGGTAGSPVIFPYSMREELLSYSGDRGGRDILRRVPCNTYEASYEWELRDVDTPENMEEVRAIYNSVFTKQN